MVVRKKRSNVKEISDDVSKTLLSTEKKLFDLSRRKTFSTGSTLLNLALAEDINGGICEGTAINIIGDSQAGKTFLAWSILAEFCHNKNLSNYDLYYNEPERSLQIDLPKLFGDKILKVDRNVNTRFIQDWYESILGFIKKGKPFVSVIDSYDAMDDVHEADMKPEEIGAKGGYRTGKAIASSQIFRKITDGIYNTKSILTVVSQTRDNLGYGAMFKPKTRFGGNALDFYCSLILWLSIIGSIKKKDRIVGVNVQARISKNKRTGKLRTVEFPILYDYGIDDITSMVNFLVNEGFWKKEKGKQIIQTEDPFIDASIDKLIDDIEARELQDDLKNVVKESWMSIEEDIKPKRKPKYE